MSCLKESSVMQRHLGNIVLQDGYLGQEAGRSSQRTLSSTVDSAVRGACHGTCVGVPGGEAWSPKGGLLSDCCSSSTEGQPSNPVLP